jgi:hypothetical protein
VQPLAVGELGEAVERLEQLYAQLPALACLGLCEHSRNEHTDASTAERQRLLAAGVDLDAPTSDGACPALTRTFGAGRRSVHAIRPTICRLWGATASMPCPHGCRPDSGLVGPRRPRCSPAFWLGRSTGRITDHPRRTDLSRTDREVRETKSAFAGRQSRLVIRQPDQPIGEKQAKLRNRRSTTRRPLLTVIKSGMVARSPRQIRMPVPGRTASGQ